MVSPLYFHIPDFIIYIIMFSHGLAILNGSKEEKHMKEWEYPWMPILLAFFYVVSVIAAFLARNNPLTAFGGTAILERRGEMAAIILCFMYAVGVTPFGPFLPLDEKNKTLPHGYQWTLYFIPAIVVLSYWINFIHFGQIEQAQKEAVEKAEKAVKAVVPAVALAQTPAAPGAAFGKTRTFGKKKI